MNTKRFLIQYPPGARGDFFGSVLIHNSRHLLKFFKMTLNMGLVAKTHDFEKVYCSEKHPLFGFLDKETILEQCRQQNIIKIGITTDSIEEKIDTVYFHHLKNYQQDGIPFDSMPNIDTEMQEFSGKYENFVSVLNQYFEEFKIQPTEFDYLISFNDLFDVAKLVEFYTMIHSQPPSDRLMDAIKFNIDNNKRFSKSQYFNDFFEKIT